MTRQLISILSALAVVAMVFAAPAPGILPEHKSGSPLVATHTTSAATSKATPTAHGTPNHKLISIPDALIDSATVVNKDPTSKYSPIPGGSNNSTLIQVRPDLQSHVHNGALLSLNKTISKKDTMLSRRDANDCIGSVDLDQPTWNKIAVKICKEWYPDASSFQYDPSSTWPKYLQSSTIPHIYVGQGLTVSLTFEYGVEDWGLDSAYGWQPYYEPQSQSICIADLQVLISEMVNDNYCLGTSGYDTSGLINGNTAGGVQDATGTGQPKWYTFSAN